MRIGEREANAYARKIELVLKVAIQEKYRIVVLGAFGCGAHGTPPKHAADIHLQVLNEVDPNGEFFDLIAFAILEDMNSYKRHNPQGNLRPFSDTFTDGRITAFEELADTPSIDECEYEYELRKAQQQRSAPASRRASFILPRAAKTVKRTTKGYEASGGSNSNNSSKHSSRYSSQESFGKIGNSAATASAAPTFSAQDRIARRLHNTRGTLGTRVNLDGTLRTNPTVTSAPQSHQQAHSAPPTSRTNPGDFPDLIYFGGHDRRAAEAATRGPSRRGMGLAAAIYSDLERNLEKKKATQREMDESKQGDEVSNSLPMKNRAKIADARRQKTDVVQRIEPGPTNRLHDPAKDDPNEPAYFHFGRPGNGAPILDAATRSTVDAKLLAYKGNEAIEKPRVVDLLHL
ncbi:hypothetical protein HDU82_007189 [Entophlyctis luteolus]|nr:hypothetical protein HDU82_007189 [Entophlyctis luteolus]